MVVVGGVMSAKEGVVAQTTLVVSWPGYARDDLTLSEDVRGPTGD